MKYTESEKVELKPSLSQLNEIVETIVGFANTQGGKIFIGISNAGDIIGIEIGKSTIEKLVNTIKQNTEPSQYPKIIVKTIGGKNIIEVDAIESKEKPVLAFGRAFKRVGKSTLKVDKDEHEKMVIEKKKIYFDVQICEGATPSDIDEEKVRQFVREAQRQRNFDLEESSSLDDILMRLKLISGKKINNAAVLLFGKDTQKFFLQAVTKVIRFKGIDVTGEMLDFKNIEGDILIQLRRAEDFIFEHIPQKAWIEEGKLERQEKWLYPPRALREALANAFAHRDYQSTSGVQVRIFDDRLEIWNPGILPKQLTIQKLKGKHESIPHNPMLARFFFLIKYGEEVGTGTNKIIKWCQEWGLPEPQIEVTGTSLVVTFFRFFISDEVMASLHERQKKAVEYVKTKEKITNQKYQQINMVSKATATRELQELVEKGVLSRVGETGKGTYYQLLERARKGLRKGSGEMAHK